MVRHSPTYAPLAAVLIAALLVAGLAIAALPQGAGAPDARIVPKSQPLGAGFGPAHAPAGFSAVVRMAAVFSAVLAAVVSRAALGRVRTAAALAATPLARLSSPLRI